MLHQYYSSGTHWMGPYGTKWPCGIVTSIVSLRDGPEFMIKIRVYVRQPTLQVRPLIHYAPIYHPGNGGLVSELEIHREPIEPWRDLNEEELFLEWMERNAF